MDVVNHAFSSLFGGGGKRGGTMEQFRVWIRRLSAYSIITRYVFCTAIVGIVTVVQLIANLLPAGYVFILYYPVVTLAALLLDRGAGFYATILSAFLVVLLFIEPRFTLTWSAAAQDRLQRLPSFARGMVAKGVERYAREHGVTLITPDTMQTVREQAEQRFGRRFTFRTFFRSQKP